MSDYCLKQLVYICNTITFASYADLTSKDGKKYLVAQNGKTPFTHYAICKVRRLVFIGMERLPDGRLKVEFRRALPLLESEIKHIVITPRLGIATIEEISGCYPDIRVKLSTGDSLPFASLFEFLCHVQASAQDDIGDLLDMEVVYVGQTEISSRYIRLDGHETYCKAADEISKKEPECELFIKILHFETPNIIVIENVGYGEDEKKMLRERLNKAPLKHWVTLIEAAMINYMQPKYNVHYKNKFPSWEHIGYKYFFDGSFDKLKIIVNEDMRLYSTRHPDGNCKKSTEIEFNLLHINQANGNGK